MNDNTADDSQALQGLYELLFNLGNLENLDTSENLDATTRSNSNIQSNSEVSSKEITPTRFKEVLIGSESIPNQEKLVVSEHFLDPFDYVDFDRPNEEENLTSSELVNVPNVYPLARETKAKNNNPANNEGAIASLQSLLLGSDLQTLKTSVHNLDRKIEDLEHQIYDPQELIQLLVPVITEILGIKVSQASAEITEAIAPVIDEMITVNIAQDRVQMTTALAPVMSNAIAQNIATVPGEFAAVIAPEMGSAIQEQLRINKGAMIDALYPIIGNTITKYLAEAIKAINEKVENTFSKEGILRKIRAKLQGVSEAELILKESIPFTIRAIFLIHKTSGLIISELQNPHSDQILESDMVAGMLTAIRSFVNDCITQSGFDTELSEIDYGGSKIILEAAGFCYLAVVVEGVASANLTHRIRETLEVIVTTHSKSIENFNGDPDTVPQEIKPNLSQIFISSTPEPKKSANSHTLLVLILLLISAIAIPWGIFNHRQQMATQLQEQVELALFTSPELSIYGITVNVDQNQQIQLQGRVPNSYLKNLATDLATKEAIASTPSSIIKNQIIAVNVPPDPILTAAEIKRITSLLNQLDGIKITTEYKPNFANPSLNKLIISGKVRNLSAHKTINSAFAQIPGVAIVTNTIQVQPPQITTRIYFAFNSAQISAAEMPKILQMKLIMDQNPNYRLKIIGHTDRLGSLEDNRRIALNRALAVQNQLVKLGLPAIRLESIGSPSPVQNTPELSRYVGFALTLVKN